ncbi:MAG: hypothetical protein HY960_01590 [Ignavibacteriae bacterium]|nr:hypothetical protein [Ignavibacteriota bacterium]
MSNISSEGLEDEYRSIDALCTTYASVLEKRGVTAEVRANYASAINTMTMKRAAYYSAESSKEELTREEKQARAELLTVINAFRQAAKDTFPARSPLLKKFHVGDNHGNSTKTLLAWADDIKQNFSPENAPMKQKGGILDEDLDALTNERINLASKDSQQKTMETSTIPTAFKELTTSMNDVKTIADFIQGKAKMVFAKDKVTLKKFEQAKRLRFTQPGTKPKAPEPPPAK